MTDKPDSSIEKSDQPSEKDPKKRMGDALRRALNAKAPPRPQKDFDGKGGKGGKGPKPQKARIQRHQGR